MRAQTKNNICNIHIINKGLNNHEIIKLRDHRPC